VRKENDKQEYERMGWNSLATSKK